MRTGIKAGDGAGMLSQGLRRSVISYIARHPQDLMKRTYGLAMVQRWRSELRSREVTCSGMN